MFVSFSDIIEPSVPFTLGIMISNTGYGIARELEIKSAQPRIIDNEKGLLIEFKILSAQLEDQEINPSLKIKFGTINPLSTTVGRWIMSTTLQGTFSNYSAEIQHITSLGE